MGKNIPWELHSWIIKLHWFTSGYPEQTHGEYVTEQPGAGEGQAVLLPWWRRTLMTARQPAWLPAPLVLCRSIIIPSVSGIKNKNNLKKIQRFAVISVSNCNLENQAGASWERTSARSRARGSKRWAASQPPKYHSRHTCDSKPAQSKGTNFKRHTVLFQVQPVHQRVIWLV